MKTMLTILCLGALVGCGDLVSSPVPQPVPSYIRQSTPQGSRVETLVVGLPSAVAGGGKVHLRDRATGASAVAVASDSGSFAGVVPIGGSPDLEARYENKDGLSEPVSLRTRGFGVHPALVPALDNSPPVSSPDAQGQVTVTNDAGPGNPLHFNATPNTDALVSNSSKGAVVATVTDKDGRLTAKLAGATGETIEVLLVDPANPVLTSDYLTFTVP
jgi:hypothetical protein